MSAPARLRFRVYVGGTLLRTDWLGMNDDMEAAGAAHLAATQRAEADGQTWMIEVFNPLATEQSAYVRFGTDDRAMVRPETIEVDKAIEAGPLGMAMVAMLLGTPRPPTTRKEQP